MNKNEKQRKDIKQDSASQDVQKEPQVQPEQQPTAIDEETFVDETALTISEAEAKQNLHARHADPPPLYATKDRGVRCGGIFHHRTSGTGLLYLRRPASLHAYQPGLP